jgi:hypothetical protein
MLSAYSKNVVLESFPRDGCLGTITEVADSLHCTPVCFILTTSILACRSAICYPTIFSRNHLPPEITKNRVLFTLEREKALVFRVSNTRITISRR